MAPSRELAVQIFKVIKDFEELLGGLSPLYLIGGTKLEHDLSRIKSKGCALVVGTVGRVFDLMEKGELSFKQLEMLVMDEADKLLEDGHANKINYILSALPKQRRTGLFSATITSGLKNLIKIGMRNPFFIEVRIEEKGIFAKKRNGKQEEKGIIVKEFSMMETK